MCPSADPLAEDAVCGSGPGWIVFEDPDADCDRADAEELIAGTSIDTDVMAATNSGCLSFAGTGFKRVVAGWLHACGITTSDTVLCWGDNRSGQLGIGGIDAAEVPATEHRVPAPISSDEKFADLSLGATQTCGITLDHRAFCWGTNATGQLGDGTTTSRGTPTLVAGGLKFVAIAVSSGFAGGTNVIPPVTGAQGSVGHTCALTVSGAPYCWGWNSDGQLGDGTTIERHAPVAVQGSLTLTTIGAGGASTCGMRQRAVWCWGANRSGQLGNGSIASSVIPVAVGAPFATP